MNKPSVGDTVRVPREMFGKIIEVCEFKLEEFHFCLGFFESDAHRAASKFTPLCDLIEPAPDATWKYWSNFGEYVDKYVQRYEIISAA